MYVPVYSNSNVLGFFSFGKTVVGPQEVKDPRFLLQLTFTHYILRSLGSVLGNTALGTVFLDTLCKITALSVLGECISQHIPPLCSVRIQEVPSQILEQPWNSDGTISLEEDSS